MPSATAIRIGIAIGVICLTLAGVGVWVYTTEDNIAARNASTNSSGNGSFGSVSERTDIASIHAALTSGGGPSEATTIKPRPRPPLIIDGRNASTRGRPRPKADDLKKKLGMKFGASLPSKFKGIMSSTCALKTRTYSGTIPTSFDARTHWKDCLSPVLDQGTCGSCWAFATAQVMSDRLCIAGRAASRQLTKLLSPQQFVSCDHSCSYPEANQGCNDGCNGGSLDAPWTYASLTGAVGLTCMPYTSAAGTRGTCPAAEPYGVPSCTTGEEFSNEVYKSNACYQLPTVESIQAEILQYGSVVAGMMAYSDFLVYEQGIYTVGATATEAGGHAIRLIGWGEENGVKYWVGLNQWSEDWGMGGVVHIRRGTNEALIESIVIAAEMQLPATDVYEPYSLAMEVQDANAAFPTNGNVWLSIAFALIMALSNMGCVIHL